MNDMSQVIIPKSDQWNADDFIAGPMTFTIADVKIAPGTEQPVNIVLDGTEKFFRPCKSMSRVLVGAWGADAKAYVGRSLTLYRDPEVKWGGMAVGGIRISHLSHIDGAKVMVLTATKGSRKPFKVMPLVVDATKQQATATEASDVDWDGWFESFKSAIAQQTSEQKLKAWRAPEGIPDQLLQDARAVIDQRIAALAPAAPSTGFDDTPTKPGETLLDALDSQGPGATKADQIIDEVKAALATMDVDMIEAREQANLEAMQPEIAESVRQVFTARREEILAERAKAPAQ